MSEVLSALPMPPVYYDASMARGTYWIEDAGGIWIPINESSARRHLKAAGYSHETAPGEVISPLEQCLVDLQRKQNLDYAGALAG